MQETEMKLRIKEQKWKKKKELWSVQSTSTTESTIEQ